MAIATVYNKSAPAGIPGTVARSSASTIEPGLLDQTDTPTEFGTAVVFENTVFRKFKDGDSASNVYGFLARSIPMASSEANEDAPNKLLTQSILKFGYIDVVAAVGTPVRGQPVYIRTVADTGKLIGALETAADNTITASAMVGTGNATAGTLSVADDVVAGVYKILCSAPTVFNVVSPDGVQSEAGSMGAEFSAFGVTFTVTAGGTAAEAGDYINLTVAKRTEIIPKCVWAVDGKDSAKNTELRIVD